MPYNKTGLRIVVDLNSPWTHLISGKIHVSALRASCNVAWISDKVEKLSKSAECVPLDTAHCGLDVFLAGAVLAEVIRMLMPIPQWIFSHMSLPVYFPRIEEVFQKELFTVDDIHIDTLVIVGAGALGTWFTYALLNDQLAFNVSNIVLVDDDTVDITNLNRQVLFSHHNINEYKADVIAQSIQNKRPWIEVKPMKEKISDTDFFRNRDVQPDMLISCLDAWKPRALLNQIALENRIPLVNGGTDPWSCNVYTYVPGASPCLNCAMGVVSRAARETDARSCATVQPSVVFTNMIAAGIMLWSLKHPDKSSSGILHYDLTLPNRIGFGESTLSRHSCKCIEKIKHAV